MKVAREHPLRHVGGEHVGIGHTLFYFTTQGGEFGEAADHLRVAAKPGELVAHVPGALDASEPGLLARIAYTLANSNINVASAKINTLGERAEDVFLIDGARLHDEAALVRLETALYEQLRIA